MRNLMLTICLSLMVSLAFSQIHVVAPSGNVGVGITNPTQKLDVSGNLLVRGPELNIGKWAGANQASLQIGFERGSNGKASFELIADKSSYPDWGFRFIRFSNGYTNLDHRGTNSLVFNCKDGAATYFGTLGSARFSIHTNKIESTVQAFKPGGGMWAGTSDERLKKDIKRYHKGLKEVLSINPVSYKYNSEIVDLSDETHIGVIAQEVQKVVPSMVKQVELTDRASRTHEGYLSVDPSEFVYMLINAVKEQEQTISKLGNELTELKKKVEDQSPKIGISSTIEGSGKASLNQNVPNPLKDFTKIEFFVPEKAANAFLTIENMAGQQIKRIDIEENGKGFIELKLEDLAAGIYTYSLKVDGNTIDTKKMIVE